MKAAIYSRVSTEDQNAETQIKLCQEFCERHGHEIFDVYCDEGISGMKTSRPAFNRMLEDMRHYKFNCIVVVRIDRLGRSLQHLLSLFDEFARKGVNFVSIDNNFDTSTPQGMLFLQITGAFVEYERNIISERTKEGLRGKKNVGKRGPDKRPRKRRDGLRKKIDYGVRKNGG